MKTTPPSRVQIFDIIFYNTWSDLETVNFSKKRDVHLFLTRSPRNTILVSPKENIDFSEFPTHRIQTPSKDF
jgi:hypothetical protein